MKVSAFVKGDVGEVITASRLRELGFVVIRNMYLPVDDKKTEIDIVAVSSDGIFLIENKNYTGSVRGNTENKYWTVRHGFTGTYSFINPLIQNNFHLQALNKLFDNKYPIYVVVIFNDGLKGLEITGYSKNAVFKLRDFEIYIKERFIGGTHLDKEASTSVIAKLRKYSDTSVQAKVEFVTNELIH